MKNFTFLFIIIPFFLFSQTQIGADIDGEVLGEWSGYSVSLSSDGNIVAIGGPTIGSGHVRVYQNISNIWTQIGADINGEAVNDYSGCSVSLSSNGSILAIGALYNTGNGNEPGHVRVYQNISNVWTQIGGDIDGEAAGDQSGFSVSLSSDGNIVAIGARFNDGDRSDKGHVRVYENISGTWTQIGDDIDGEETNDESGFSISLSSNGSVVAIGAPFNNGNGTDSGHVRVYQNISNIWTQIGDDINGEALEDQSGWSVSLSSDGNIVAIGANGNDDNGGSSGHVRVYENINGTWTQIGSDIDGEAGLDESGFSVSLSSDGSIVGIGAFFNDGNGSNSGHVRVYQNISGVWMQIGQDIDGEAGSDQSGYSVSLSSNGDRIAIGAPQNSSSGHVRVYDLSGVLSADSFNVALSRIYPNPATTEIHITLKNNLQLLKVNLYNQLGQLLKQSKSHTINVSDISKGMYLVEIETNQGKGTKKVLIE